MTSKCIFSRNKFGEKTTAEEVIKGHNLKGYDVIVTGASSGIGVETARVLALAGARVVLAVRDIAKTEPIAKEIREKTGNDQVEIEKLDLTSLASVDDFVKRYLAKNRPLHILINNAGIMACPFSKTADGFELQFGTNHVGPFALAKGLVPALKEAAKQTGRKSRVISVSSLAHMYSDIVFDDINFEKREYDSWKSYGQSKTANILFSVGFTMKYEKDGIVSNALMPGIIMTGLQKHMSSEEMKNFGMVDEHGNYNTNFKGYKSIEQGASTTVWAAVAPELEGKGGLYLEDCQIVDKTTTFEEASINYKGLLGYAIDRNNAERLWNVTEQMINSAKTTSFNM